mmetsp:Transcript_6879/g.20267  ORF Transcript_6879/g.20267 Transcript_6879/m.20267 type:complete len:238 (-) Transcript_6879:1562-2275(-)
MMVLSRCATVMIVEPGKSSRSTVCSRASFSTSTLAVASSKSITGFLHRSALAMQTSCRSPCEKLLPFSCTISVREKVSRISLRPALAQAAATLSSTYTPVGSRFFWSSPENMTGSCGMTVTVERSILRPMLATSMPATLMVPWQGSTRRISASSTVLFPDPLRPTMPTRSPASTVNVTPHRAGSICSWYFRKTSSKATLAPGFETSRAASLSRTRAASCGAWRTCCARSTAASCDSA